MQNPLLPALEARMADTATLNKGKHLAWGEHPAYCDGLTLNALTKGKDGTLKAGVLFPVRDEAELQYVLSLAREAANEFANMKPVKRAKVAPKVSFEAAMEAAQSADSQTRVPEPAIEVAVKAPVIDEGPTLADLAAMQPIEAVAAIKQVALPYLPRPEYVNVAVPFELLNAPRQSSNEFAPNPPFGTWDCADFAQHCKDAVQPYKGAKVLVTDECALLTAIYGTQPFVLPPTAELWATWEAVLEAYNSDQNDTPDSPEPIQPITDHTWGDVKEASEAPDTEYNDYNDDDDTEVSDWENEGTEPEPVTVPDPAAPSLSSRLAAIKAAPVKGYVEPEVKPVKLSKAEIKRQAQFKARQTRADNKQAEYEARRAQYKADEETAAAKRIELLAAIPTMSDAELVALNLQGITSEIEGVLKAEADRRGVDIRTDRKKEADADYARRVLAKEAKDKAFELARNPTASAFRVSAPELCRALDGIIKVVPGQTREPLHHTVLMRVSEDVLTLVCTNGSVRLDARVKVQQWPFQGFDLCLPAKMLLSLLKALPDQPLTFSSTVVDVPDSEPVAIATIEAEGKQYTFRAECGVNFPIEELDFAGAKVAELPLHAFVKAVEAVTPFASKDELKPSMQGMYCQFGTDGSEFACTDAHRLGAYTRADIQVATPFITLLPVTLCSAFLKAAIQGNGKNARYAGETVRMEATKTGVRLTCGDVVMLGVPIEARFPDYNNVIPVSSPNRAILNKSALLKTLKSCATFANRSTGLVRLTFGGPTVTFVAQDSDFSNSYTEQVSCLYEGSPLEIGFNVNFMADLIKAIPTADVVFELDTPGRAAVILPTEQPDSAFCLYLLMPVMLGSQF